jgi:uncharacterized sulfatase
MNNSMRLLAVLAFALTAGLAAAAETGGKPNFVWILSEDNSKHYLKLFDPSGASAPNIAKLAAEGLVFDRAFSCSPVCSVARTTLATCIYAPRLGTQYHRRTKLASMPAGWRMFPAYLRDTGYYTTNNSKKDYNAVEGPGVWDESSGKAGWRNRPSKDTPFFHMESHGVSHESSLHFPESQMTRATETDREKVAIAPYHPDTPMFRYTYARYHDRMHGVDEIVGATVAKLREDGLLEDTFIFYFGDHGGVLPRSKGYIYESGLHVPLVVRVPEKWKHLVDAKRGERVKGFVSFVDFGATVMHLAGVPVPKQMDGRPLLGAGVKMAEVNRRDEAFGYADRFDEKYELCRSLRKGRYKYIRNYQGYYPDGLQNNYRYRMIAFSQWRQMYRDGKLNAVQRQFFEGKPAELLFDVEADPHETRNLAGDPAHAETLKDLRKRLAERLRGMPDLSFYPESVMVAEALDDPIAFGRKHKEEIGRLIDVADLAVLPFDEARAKLLAALDSDDPWQRYWALTDCAVFGEQAKPLADKAKAALHDDEPLVRVRAAEFLAIVGAVDPRPTLLEVLRTSDSYLVAAITLNSVVYLQDFKGFEFKLSGQDIKATGNSVGRRLEYFAGAATEKSAKEKRRKKTARRKAKG